jgi:hypothetical protein
MKKKISETIRLISKKEGKKKVNATYNFLAIASHKPG